MILVNDNTGNYYYGARYYDPKVSVWLSVDPLATKYPHVSPYNFVENNPLRLIDPTGMGPEDPEKAKSTTENTVISGTVDENNTTHVNQTTINSKRRQLEDGTTVIDEKITEVTNEVRNSDGQVAKGKVNTFSRTGVIDAEGNLSYSPKVRAGTRDQKEGEFKDLDAWTGFISDYSAKNKENYNVQSFNKGGALTSLAGGVGTLPVTIFGGGTIPLSSAIKSVLGAFKVPLNVSSAATSAGGAGTYYLGSNSNYFQIYGVSQSYNGVRTKQMRQPQ